MVDINSKFSILRTVHFGNLIYKFEYMMPDLTDLVIYEQYLKHESWPLLRTYGLALE